MSETISSPLKNNELIAFFKRLPRWLVILLLLPLIILNGWMVLETIEYFQSLISTFIAASLLAFLLNYPTQLLQQLKIPRSYAVLLIFLLGLVSVSFLLFFTFPLLVSELQQLADRVPNWVESADLQIQTFADWAAFDQGTWSADFKTTVRNQLQSWLVSLPNLALAIVNNFFRIFLILVLTIFFAISCQSFLRQTVISLLPNNQGNRVLQLLSENFHSYILNQITLAILIASAMIPTFWLLNVPFAILFGLGIGIMGLIPFCAILSIGVVSLLLALKSVWLALKVFVIALTLDQIIENTVTPRFLGSLTGLNPIVVLFSLMIGAKVAGYLGVLVAVPIAATIKALLTPSTATISGELVNSK